MIKIFDTTTFLTGMFADLLESTIFNTRHSTIDCVVCEATIRVKVIKGESGLEALASSYVYQFIYDCVLTNRKAVILAIYTFMPPGKFNEQPAGRHKSRVSFRVEPIPVQAV